ncbi:hypothetical protein [Syntrophomonas palmitatica]|uniref:hypothetical protein n=1 Tax=Syntrophomonas palmitatica TaxID=402877 RepID=UPI0006CF5449|nr:hypothetical protein [Syntrophomonas palmitatica]
MHKVRSLFALLLMSVFLLVLSCCGLLISDNSLYIMAIFLTSLAATYICYTLYDLRVLPKSETRQEYYFYFIDSSPQSQDVLYQQLKRRA